MINLQKSQEKAGIHLQKQGIDMDRLPNIRVGICLDVSGSMHGEFHHGHVQEALGHLMGLAMHLDKQDSAMEVFLFDDSAHQIRAISPANAETYVENEILHHHGIWNGTSYAPVIHKVYQHYHPDKQHLHSAAAVTEHHSLLGGLFHRKKHQPSQEVPANVDTTVESPVLILFLTDGECNDHRHTQEALHASANLNIFWAFVGISHDSSLLREFAEESDAEFVALEHIRVSDDEIFQSVVTPKFAEWLKRQTA